MRSNFGDKRILLPSSSDHHKVAHGSNDRRRKKITLYLSQKAKENLEKLRLKSLDKRGRKPAESQIIENLINSAAKSDPDVPYPANKASR
jgi:hypothetical protein